MRVPKLLLSPEKIKIFGQKKAKFGPKFAFVALIGLAGSFGAPLVGGCGARAISRKTPIYFMELFYRLMAIRSVWLILVN